LVPKYCESQTEGMQRMILNLGGSTSHASHFQFCILRQNRSRMVIQTPTHAKIVELQRSCKSRINVVQDFGSVIVLRH
jgi:hypothetical protein